MSGSWCITTPSSSCSSTAPAVGPPASAGRASSRSRPAPWAQGNVFKICWKKGRKWRMNHESWVMRFNGIIIILKKHLNLNIPCSWIKEATCGIPYRIPWQRGTGVTTSNLGQKHLSGQIQDMVIHWLHIQCNTVGVKSVFLYIFLWNSHAKWGLVAAQWSLPRTATCTKQTWLFHFAWVPVNVRGVARHRWHEEVLYLVCLSLSFQIEPDPIIKLMHKTCSGQESHTNNDIYIYTSSRCCCCCCCWCWCWCCWCCCCCESHAHAYYVYNIYIYIYHDQVSCDQIQCLSFLDVISNQTAWWGWYSSPLFKG